jgi:hypothetical protein
VADVNGKARETPNLPMILALIGSRGLSSVRMFDTKRKPAAGNAPRLAAKTPEPRLGADFRCKLLILLKNIQVTQNSFER